MRPLTLLLFLSACGSKSSIPAECAAYQTAVEKVLTCEAIPQNVRDQLKQNLAAQDKLWPEVQGDGRDAIAKTCERGRITIERTLAKRCPTSRAAQITKL